MNATAIQKQIDYVRAMDEAHEYRCPYCSRRTTKLASQKTCQHCQKPVTHLLNIYGQFRTSRKGHEYRGSAVNAM